jgi:hypothetical protein
MLKRFIVAATFLAASFGIAGCQAAVSNVQTIISDDCGQTWHLVPVGNTIPIRSGLCALMVTVPNYPMAGESNFRGTFKNRVRVALNASYSYTIVDPLKYISGARFVGRQNSSGDDPANGASVWDMAEDIIIDRHLRDIANTPEFLQGLDIVDYDEAKLDDDLMKKMNEDLATRGVRLDTFAFVVTPDDQTRNMIDVAAALRVCGSIENTTRDTCEHIITARAGAPRMTVNTAATHDDTN